MGNETTAATVAKPVETQSVTQNQTALARFGKETCDAVLKQIETYKESGQLVLPANYHAGNALKAAWLYLQTIANRQGQRAIDICTKDSICNCLLEMVTKGEYPNQHCYFIMTQDKLTFWERYTGKLMRAKRDAGIKSVNAQVVYEGDEFVYTVDEDGNYQLVSHKTSLDNVDITKIKAAYAVVIDNDGNRHLEVMTIEQIKKAWNQGATKGQSGAHQNFSDQMAKRTVISRACKIANDSAVHSNVLGSNDDEDSMVPLADAAAERDFANRIPSHAATQQLPQGSTFAEPDDTDYEEVGQTPTPEPVAIPASQPAAKSSSRACPV